ncbi:MAG: bifunctional glutamate N-acetyltransferase/amino-acid acetyltransferase ArgJ [Thermodesulfobacteriota bacterium]|nr:bifunctional glutamate N-acetyltransferase/amino-acid acetyltransferase ArgJ [Thermodesulfobacteriota bacterium]
MNVNKNFIIPGFAAAGIAAGIKKDGGPDLGLIFSEFPAVTMGAYTTNKIKSAPVILNIKRSEDPFSRAIIVNSGNANACTGNKGLEDAKSIISHLSRRLSIDENSIYIASTGVIGSRLPVKNIINHLPGLIQSLRPDGFLEFARAIMTTDTFPKMAFRKFILGDKEVTMGGIAKGAGMIMPDLATMLSFIVSDVAIEISVLKKLFAGAVDDSFNRISVDGETSTNDTVLMIANGQAKNSPLTFHSEELSFFDGILRNLMQELAGMIVKDGEGATKQVTIWVKGTSNKEDAVIAARNIANSPLVKTALYGEDANWGRIISALGKSGITLNPDRINIFFDSVQVVKNGIANHSNWEEEVKNVMSLKKFQIIIDLNLGTNDAKILTCDLTPEYININSDYRS